eukprot:1158630-Pelagomonas_calceolata.AAC.8
MFEPCSGARPCDNCESGNCMWGDAGAPANNVLLITSDSYLGPTPALTQTWATFTDDFNYFII